MRALVKTVCWCSLIIFFSYACSSPASKQTGIDAMLQQAGENRTTLQKVITHYQESGDSLKLKAALFLIENMDWGYSYTGEAVDRYNAVFASICGLQTYPAIGAAFNKFKEEFGVLNVKNLTKVNDVNQISADFLIENIDLAFDAWRNNPWSKDIDFDLFCKAILPYRVENEPLEHWRPMFLDHFKWLKDSLQGSTDPRRVFALMNHYKGADYQFSTRWNYPFLPKYSETLDCGVGTCDILASILISALRAQGIPAVKDMVPMWGNRNYGHAWAVILDKDGNAAWCYGEEDSIASNHLPVPASILSLDTLGTKYLPPSLKFDTIKTIPKIYRIQFWKDPERLKLLADKHADELTDFYKNPRVRDVTAFYIKNCKDITVELNNIPSRAHYAYLAVLNRQEWEPVAAAKIEGNRATFKDMGQHIVYLPIAIINNKKIPIGNPVYLDQDQLHVINPDVNHLQSIDFSRKTPLFGYTVKDFNRMVRGRFEGANKADFSDAKIVHIIQKAPIYMDSVEFDIPEKFRYVRYLGPKDRPNGADIAEFEIFTSQNGQERPLDGAVTGTPPLNGVTFDVIKDGDWDSYYASSQRKDAWIGYDLGAPQWIHKIRFCPRNDTNIIIPGMTYMLSYWNDKEWVRVGVKKATDRHLTFEKVPAGALFWVHCVNSGREESPFIIVNGEQVFL